MKIMSSNRLDLAACLRAGVLGLLGVSVTASAALAHAVVYPSEAPAGAYQKYVLRVPNERGFATTEVSIVFPEGVRVISFDEVTGWTLEATSSDGGATFAMATWRGELPVGRFVEFAFIGVNPAEEATLEWDVVQTYGDGQAVEWTGPVDSATPASFTRIRAPIASTLEAQPASGTANGLAVAALLVALLGLGVALRPAKSAREA
jgi:uncharacterized protein YcnI